MAALTLLDGSTVYMQSFQQHNVRQAMDLPAGAPVASYVTAPGQRLVALGSPAAVVALLAGAPWGMLALPDSMLPVYVNAIQVIGVTDVPVALRRFPGFPLTSIVGPLETIVVDGTAAAAAAVLGL